MALFSLFKLFWTTPTSRTSFQVLSDLHLEVGQQYSSFDFPATAPYLILAGDIGQLSDYDAFRSFLAIQTTRFELVLLVLGNHKFYGSSHTKTLELATRMEKEPELNDKLMLLHRKKIDVPNSNITILGCSLWSHIPDDAKLMVKSKVNDFKKIEGWSPDSHTKEYEKDIRWLKDQVEIIQKGNKALKPNRTLPETTQKRFILVVTHHAPCLRGTSEPKFDDSPWTSAFATDLLKKADDWSDVKAWVYGHTHYSTELTKAGVRVLSNQRGYVLPGSERKLPKGCGKGKWRKFDPGFVLHL
jgi:predicted phosphodiesterase